MNLKNWKGIYEQICWGPALVLQKKNLPGRDLTKAEKHCLKVYLFCVYLRFYNQWLMS